MIIKKYLAKTEKEAIEMAKEELGNDAVVMNIKKVHPKGLAKLFVRSKVEVTAALDEAVDAEPVKTEESAQAPKADRSERKTAAEQKPDGESESSLQGRLNALQLLLEQQMQEKEKLEREKREREAEEKKEPPRVEREKTAEDRGKEADKTTDKVTDKTTACKELIRKQLIQNEVDPEIVDMLMNEINRSLPGNASLDQILAGVYQKIILMVGQPYTLDLEKNGKAKYIFFLGSTGVGKTTTIAKLASKLKLEMKKNIALVTADTYRIAAVEQLKTYANILSVPLKVIYSPEELQNEMESLEQYDVCLVDTAGRSHKNKEQIEDIRNLIEQVPVRDRQVYLVLNAGTKYSDLREIAKVYAKLTYFSLIFTKLDETSSAGAMLNMRVQTKCPLSYVTWGQNVPEDIGEVDAQKIAKQLMGGTS